MALTAGCVTVRPDPARLAMLEPELGQLLLVGFMGTALDDNAALERLLCEARVGGVLVFARNVTDAAQVAALDAAITARSRVCTGAPVLIAMDAEGGRVMRLGPAAGYPSTLSHRELGDIDDPALTGVEAERIAARLREAGVNWNLAPVVDVALNPQNPVIVGNGRSFGAEPARVVIHARAFIAGMHAGGVLTTLKHFPGHGSSLGDSHRGFVDVSDTANADVELAPYYALMAEGFADSVMTAHVFNRHVDRRYPATLSRATITGLLRGRLGFTGLVVSDDLRMGAIEQDYGLERAAVLALGAGVDVLLIADDALPDGRSATTVALDAIRRALERGRLDPDRVAEALAHVRAFKARLLAP